MTKLATEGKRLVYPSHAVPPSRQAVLVSSSRDILIITITSSLVMKKIVDNRICIHFLNKLFPKVIKHLYSFMERKE